MKEFVIPVANVITKLLKKEPLRDIEIQSINNTQYKLLKLAPLGCHLVNILTSIVDAEIKMK